MALVACPECTGNVSDKAFSCPACGYPLGQKDGNPWPSVLGGVAGTYISAKAVTSILLGSVMFLAFAAIMIALILK
ncbi:hypothetical protein [Shinella zoogloeoides]|uniref:hypothetical protein n=1 Tax=Shinella zoogloeoides TaxID=352475 RepID=UPI00299DFF71|nr:hypothetical protein [Shinella zoogloeoides]WPE23666.1 hypothetical protein ShzoTeo12_48860 [Shinella zoogloeoides]